MTTPERWAQIERLYHEALACGAHERESFLAEACAADDELGREVESLLAHDGEAAYLSTPAVWDGIGGRVRIGQTVGPYLISEQIGEGGMGEVYRARDAKLGRDVAIKIVSPLFALDPDRLARFEREARLLASLSHPHIGAIYGFEESNGVRALVLELVEGETLESRLAGAGSQGLPVADVLAIAEQIADALDSAHERGIIHRDLKPANITITRAGTVKILDFGLAKVVGAQLSQAPTVTLNATGAGTILGTAAYMSPEQARGQPVDKRTDVWAFGCVLYELLTGRPAFARPTVSDTIAAILTQEPDWEALPLTTPSHISRLLRRCLAKDPMRRQRDIGDARFELALADETQVVDRKQQNFPFPLPRIATATAGIVAVALVAVGFAFGVFLKPRAAPPVRATVARFSVLPPQGTRFFHNVGTTFLALSPDGSQMAFVAVAPPNPPVIWIRPISAPDAHVVPGTEGAISLFWSPDGRSLAFFADGKLKRIDLPAGAAVPLCDVPAPAAFGTWGRRDTILFASFMGDAIFSVSSDGGRPEAIVTPDAAVGEQVVWPSFLPDGKRFLYLSLRPNSSGYLMLGERGHAPWSIMPGLSNVQWIDPDYIVFVREGLLVAQRVDLTTERIVGAPLPVVEPVDHFLSTGRALFTTSLNGTIAYHSFSNVARFVWIDRSGQEVGTVSAPGDYLTVRLSPDGETALTPRTRPRIGTWDIWTTDLVRNVERHLTSNPASEAYPVWMPDGRAILFADGRDGVSLNLALKRLDTDVEKQLIPDRNLQRRPIDVSRDGHTLLFTQRTLAASLDIFMLPLSGQATPSALFASPFNEADPRFSPDGRAMAFTSDESGRFEVYVAPFPPTGGKIPVSAGGVYVGIDLQEGARWSRDGRELFYVSADRHVMSVPVRTTPTLEVGRPSALFALQGRTWEDFDVSTNGRFLAVVPQALAGEQPLTVILNWISEVGR